MGNLKDFQKYTGFKIEKSKGFEDHCQGSGLRPGEVLLQRHRAVVDNPSQEGVGNPHFFGELIAKCILLLFGIGSDAEEKDSILLCVGLNGKPPFK